MKKLALAACLLLVPALPLAFGQGKEAGKLMQDIAKAASEDRWDAVGEHMSALSAHDDKKVWRFMVKVAEKAPPRYDLHRVLREAAEAMTSRDVQREVQKTALKSKSAEVRRQLIVHLANKKDWDTLIDAIGDPDEQAASTAVWRLVENRVEAAVEPLMKALEARERDRSGIWDVLRNGLGEMLGERLHTALEYRSLWQTVQERGGLAAVNPKPEPVVIDPDAMRSVSVRLFGREIDCTRVVFILDVSGSMEDIDPDQRDYDEPDAGSQVREQAESEAAKKKGPQGLTRLQRAQRELKKVIKHLPPSFKINIVAYSSRVKIWRANEGDIPPQLHTLDDKTREAAIEFVDKFRADGVTATDTALLRAFDVEGARCMYLLSDGKATHDGETPVPTEEILALLERYKDRHVTVHTLGFKGADREMMTAVAKATGGQYSDIQ